MVWLFCVSSILLLSAKKSSKYPIFTIFFIFVFLIFQYLTKNADKNLFFYSFFTCQTLKKRVNFGRTPQMRSAISGSVAQLVEQRIENPRVGGSNPSRATLFMPTSLVYQ